HVLHEVQQVCNRVAILQRGNLIKQGDVSELLRGSEQVEVRLNEPGETEQALAILLQAREQGAAWIADVRIERNRQGQPTLLVDAPTAHSAEINALLARNDLFASEI